MRFTFGNRLKQVWLIARQGKSLKYPMYGGIRVALVKVLWTNSAVAQLQAIHDYLAQTSPDYADCRSPDEPFYPDCAFPNSGRMVPEYERKEIREVIEGRYRIIYLVEVAQVQILTVIHGARDLRR